MALRSKTTLFNAALLKTGHKTVSSGDGSFIWQALDANYDEIVRDAFERGDFSFGKTRETLTSRSTGRWGYDDAYMLPSSVIHVVEVYLDEYSCSDLRVAWEVDAETNELLINAGSRTLEVEYRKVGQEAKWSAAFAQGIQRRLEAVIKDVTEDVDEAIERESQADFQLLRAGVKSAGNRSEERVFNKYRGRLVRAHRGSR